MSCNTGEIAELYEIVVFAAFDFNNGSSSISSTTSTPFAPAILAWMLYKSTSGPLSIHSCIPLGPKQACGCPEILITSMCAASHPDLTSAVPCTNSAFSSMYSSPQLITNAPRPTENATRRIVATNGVIALRDVNKPIVHLLFYD